MNTKVMCVKLPFIQLLADIVKSEYPLPITNWEVNSRRRIKGPYGRVIT